MDTSTLNPATSEASTAPAATDLAAARQLLEELLQAPTTLAISQHLLHWFREGGATSAEVRFAALLQVLQEDPAQTAQIAQVYFQGLLETHIYPALVTLGIFSRRGFTREFIARVYERFNPAPRDLDNLRDALGLMVNTSDDEAWLEVLPAEAWLDLYLCLEQSLDDELPLNLRQYLFKETLHALEMLSIWVAAEELEPDLMRLDRRLLELDSPLVALQREINLLVLSGWRQLDDLEQPLHDPAHLWVMLDQTREQVARLRRRGAGSGSSVSLAHLLERLDQTLDRLERLLTCLVASSEASRHQARGQLVRELLRASAEKKSLKSLWQRSSWMLSRSITQNKSDHGEHYIARDRRSYFNLMRSAAGAGLIIAVMALVKISVEGWGLSRGWEALLVSLNYGLGFVLVHLLRLTIATKQPAMTAASFAAEVEKGDNAKASHRRLAGLLVEVNRSQWAAVWGNVTTAVLLASGLALLSTWLVSRPLLSGEEVSYQLQALAPITGLALFYAAIAGVWLFCSGIIAGFFDNRAEYLNMRQRLRYHPVMLRLFEEDRRARLADYLHDNYGALAGNFIFGLLLGGTGYIGYLTGLPLDIRHVAFSSANLGYASVSGGLGVLEFLGYLVLVLMIGFVNLWVSFALALKVALKARDTQLGSFQGLLGCIFDEVRQRPLSFFFPVQAVQAQISQQPQDDSESKP